MTWRAGGAAAEIGDVQVARLDLADLATVRDFAARWDRPLDILVNNAGIMALPELTRTAGGWELQFAANHVGRAALAVGLHDALAAADGARVVVVASAAHLMSPVHFADDREVAVGPELAAYAVDPVGGRPALGGDRPAHRELVDGRRRDPAGRLLRRTRPARRASSSSSRRASSRSTLWANLLSTGERSGLSASAVSISSVRCSSRDLVAPYRNALRSAVRNSRRFRTRRSATVWMVVYAHGFSARWFRSVWISRMSSDSLASHRTSMIARSRGPRFTQAILSGFSQLAPCEQ